MRLNNYIGPPHSPLVAGRLLYGATVVAIFSKVKDDDVFRVPTEADRTRLDAHWRAIAGPGNYGPPSPRDRMDAWIVEQRLKSEQQANERLARASWVLVWATVGLVIATFGQAVVAVLNLK